MKHLKNKKPQYAPELEADQKLLIRLKNNIFFYISQ
jgi:hypothetical protein